MSTDTEIITKIQDALPELETKKVESNGEVVILHKVTPMWVNRLKLHDRRYGVNRDNRAASIQHINRLVDVIQRGRWEEDLDPIVYIDNPTPCPTQGKITSGQHRLFAIEKANIPCWIRFKGVSQDASMYVDTGRHRTVIDNVAMGFNMQKPYLSLMNHYFGFSRYCEGLKYSTASSASLTQSKSVYSIMNAYRDNCAVFHDTYKNYKQAHPLFNVKVYQAFISALIIGGADRSKIDEFVKNTISTICNNQIISDILNSYDGVHKTGINQYELCADVWNSFMNGQHTQGLNTLVGIQPELLDIFSQDGNSDNNGGY